MDDSRHDDPHLEAPPTQGTMPPGTSGSEAPADAHDLPRPFSDEPKQISGQGCGKVALFGCGGLILLFGIAMVLFALNAQDVMVWIMGKFEEQIVRGLPEDLPEEERARLEAAFDSFQQAAREGDVSQASMAALQSQIMEVSESVNKGLTREQVRELTLALERAAGVEQEGEPPPANGPPADADEE